MRKVYISGLMSFVKGFNRTRFNTLARLLRDKGFEVINPAELDVSMPITHAGGPADHDAAIWSIRPLQ